MLRSISYYFIGAFFSEFILEKLADWIFDTTPEKNPFLFPVVASAVVYMLLVSALETLERSAERICLCMVAVIGWGIMFFGDLSSIFNPPPDPSFLDMILMILFPSTVHGTIFNGLNTIGALIVLFSKRST